MKVAFVEIWGSVFGQDVKVREIEGTPEEVVDQIVSLNPGGGIRKDAKDTLNNAVWSEEVQWMCNHTIGLRVKAVESVPEAVAL